MHGSYIYLSVMLGYTYIHLNATPIAQDVATGGCPDEEEHGGVPDLE